MPKAFNMERWARDREQTLSLRDRAHLAHVRKCNDDRPIGAADARRRIIANGYEPGHMVGNGRNDGGWFDFKCGDLIIGSRRLPGGRWEIRKREARR